MYKEITKPRTLSGRYFSKKEILYVQQTAKLFPNLSRTELAETICEHLTWTTTRGETKVNACLVALEKFEQLGIGSPPAKHQQKVRQSKEIVWSADTEPQALMLTIRLDC